MDAKQYRILKRLVWDYTIPLEDIYGVIKGEKSHAGHWDFDHLFIRMLENLSWSDLLDLLGRDTLEEKLVPEILCHLRFSEKRENMNVSAKYYEEKLYLLQNGVLNIITKSGTPFFLTGGTALSRFYTHHRYSDDLDFFVVNDSGYLKYVDLVLQDLLKAEVDKNFTVDQAGIQLGQAYTKFFIVDCNNTDVELKIDLVNDVVAHYGSIICDPVLGRIDSIQKLIN